MFFIYDVTGRRVRRPNPCNNSRLVTIHSPALRTSNASTGGEEREKDGVPFNSPDDLVAPGAPVPIVESLPLYLSVYLDRESVLPLWCGRDHVLLLYLKVELQ